MKTANVVASGLTRLPARKPNAELVQMLEASGLEHLVHASGEVSVKLGNTELSFDEDGKVSCIATSDAKAA